MKPPIMTLCEGSGCPTHLTAGGWGVCSMCGERVPLDQTVTISNKAVRHQREDVLAMLARGDYG